MATYTNRSIPEQIGDIQAWFWTRPKGWKRRHLPSASRFPFETGHRIVTVLTVFGPEANRVTTLETQLYMNDTWLETIPRTLPQRDAKGGFVVEFDTPPLHQGAEYRIDPIFTISYQPTLLVKQPPSLCSFRAESKDSLALQFTSFAVAIASAAIAVAAIWFAWFQNNQLADSLAAIEKRQETFYSGLALTPVPVPVVNVAAPVVNLTIPTSQSTPGTPSSPTGPTS